MHAVREADPSIADAFLGDLLLCDLSRYEGIIRQFEFRSSHNRRAIAHGSVVSDLDIFDLRDGKHAEIVFPNGFVETFAQKLGGELFLDLLCKAAFHERLRGLARTIAGNPCLALKIARNIRPLFGDLIGWQLDAQRDEAIRLGFNNNVHVQTKSDKHSRETCTTGEFSLSTASLRFAGAENRGLPQAKCIAASPSQLQ